MKSRFSLKLVALSVFCILTASSCAPSASVPGAAADAAPAAPEVPVNQPVTVRFFGWTEREESEVGIYQYCGVETESIQQSDDYGYVNKLANMFASGTAPDILLVDTSYIAMFVDQGWLAPINESTGITRSNFEPAISNFVRSYQGIESIYGIPRPHDPNTAYAVSSASSAPQAAVDAILCLISADSQR